MIGGFWKNKEAALIAYIWIIFAFASLIVLIVATPATYFEFDLLGIWILVSIAIIYMSRKKWERPSPKGKKMVMGVGILLVAASFLDIPIGFTHSAFSFGTVSFPIFIGEYTIFLSGLGLILFGAYGLKSYLLPVSIPFLTVAGFSAYVIYLRNQDGLVGYLVPFTTSMSVSILKLIGLAPVVQGNIFTFMSRSGDPISLSIISDCSGIVSLGTFAIASIIVVSSFPGSITRSSLGWLAFGFAGTYGANIMRIIAIALSGYFFGPTGVIEKVHINIGWIIFSAWMIIFWYYFFTLQLGISFRKKKKSELQDS